MRVENGTKEQIIINESSHSQTKNIVPEPYRDKSKWVEFLLARGFTGRANERGFSGTNIENNARQRHRNK